jgi:polar amino acid transport system substrate-binding protein
MNYKSALVAFLCMAAVSTNVFPASVNDLILITENNPPSNYEENGKLKGIYVEIMEKMLKSVNSKLTISDIQIKPWARGYESIQNTKNTCLFMMAQTPERQSLFKWVGPVMNAKSVLLARKDKNIVIKSLTDIKKYKVGSIINSASEQILLKRGFSQNDFDRVGGTDAIETSIKKLEAGRIDLFVYNDVAARWVIKKLNMKPDDFVTVYEIDSVGRYFAFNKDTPDEIVKQMQDAFNGLKRSGEIQKIINKYN